MPRFARIVALALLPLLMGCHGSNTRTTVGPATLASFDGLSGPFAVDSLDAYCCPPLGWKPDPHKQSSSHDHQAWLSPTGHTAYGLIHFQLPWPVGHDLALWGFLNQMRSSEGEATLLQKHWDPNLQGLRFVAEGGLYTVRTNLFVHGFTGWAVYAGTLRAFPVESEELEIAERAREHTVLGPISTARADSLSR